jgi:hypothetical protein
VPRRVTYSVNDDELIRRVQLSAPFTKERRARLTDAKVADPFSRLGTLVKRQQGKCRQANLRNAALANASTRDFALNLQVFILRNVKPSDCRGNATTLESERSHEKCISHRVSILALARRKGVAGPVPLSRAAASYWHDSATPLPTHCVPSAHVSGNVARPNCEKGALSNPQGVAVSRSDVVVAA